ncbi:MAG: hypothetical protein H6741_17565 [Alphaproteobacteria bacterium]|nr:hypothetical protein [Alphaproteobacteria bacterium]MCB9794527.1 hypothetical protein [Alphaproteobacteria bacterium]
MTRYAPCLIALFAFSAACGGKEDDTGGGDDSGAVVDDGMSPQVTDLDAYCYEHTTGDTFFQWVVAGVATDPQGTNTLETFATVSIQRGGGEVSSQQAVVGADDGEIVGSFNADTIGVPCSSASEFTWEVTVVDDDGNSGSASVVGRQGTAGG